MSRLVLSFHIIFFLAVVAGALGAWFYFREMPLAEKAALTETRPLDAFDKRHMEHVTLHTESLGDIGLAVSLPDPLPQEKMPVLIVLGGLGTGEDNIRNIHDAGNNALIGYDWPMPVHIDVGADFLWQFPLLYHHVMRVPGQIASSLEWLLTQNWCDEKRVSILGFSLGALAVPAAQDAFQRNQHLIHSTILAYGGAPLGSVFAADKHLKPAFMRVAFAPVIDVVLHPVEPEQHLENLEGSFLVLEGKNDDLIPEDLRARLRQAVPQPKTIIDFEGNHMGVGQGKEELLQKIISTSREWLLKEEAVNPL